MRFWYNIIRHQIEIIARSRVGTPPSGPIIDRVVNPGDPIPLDLTAEIPINDAGLAASSWNERWRDFWVWKDKWSDSKMDLDLVINQAQSLAPEFLPEELQVLQELGIEF